jgi:transcriptional regulator with XRE-family HTH domain
MPSRDTVKATPLTPAQSDEANEAYGQRLRERREAVGLSQMQLADLATVHRGTIRNVEQGRPMEMRTHSNILRVLGCAPNLKNWDNRTDPKLDPVLSAKVSGFVAKILLDENVEQFLVDDYMGLISELANHRLLPAQRAFCDKLARRMREIDAEQFDAELAGLVGDAYTPRWADGRRYDSASLTAIPSHTPKGDDSSMASLITRGLSNESGLAQAVLEGLQNGVPQRVITNIVDADITDDDRRMLIEHAVKRTAELQASLGGEVGLLIDMIVKRQSS